MPEELNNTPQMNDSSLDLPHEEASMQLAARAKKSAWKRVATVFAVAIIAVVGYFGYTNPQLFLGAITEVGTPTDAGNLYIPEYTASPGDEGLISVNSNIATTTGPIDVNSIQFTLKYNPVSALSFTEDAIVFDSETVFQSADLKLVDTSVQGQVTVTFFSNNDVTIPTGQNTVAKLDTTIAENIAPGTEISVNVDNVDIVIPDGSGGFQSSSVLTAITGGKITIQDDSELKVFRAVATDDTHVQVTFSDFVKSTGSVATSNYAIEDSSANPLNIVSVVLGSNQKTVILETDPQAEGEKYTLEATGSEIAGNTQNGLNPATQNAIFYGFDATTTYSPIELQSIQVNSSTEIDLNFNENNSVSLDSNTVTPLNIDITTFDGGAPSQLTIQDIAIDANAVTVTTSKQKAGANYYVTFDGVLDTDGNPISNEAVKNFFGFVVPSVVINNVSPSTLINNTPTSVNILGNNLDTVVRASVGSTQVTITEQTKTTLTVSVPTGLAEGTYDLTLVNSVDETRVQEDALLVQAPLEPLRIVSDASKATPNRVAPDGETTVKFWVLVSDPVDVSAVDSVTINLEQIGGSRAQEMNKDTGTQSPGKQWYVYETTVAENTPTKDTPYQLPVEARKGSQTTSGSVSLTVTRDLLQSVAPSIDQVFFTPASSAPDGETEIKLSARVSDQDGADTITSVVADLSPLGAGFVNLDRLDVAGTANEQVTGWFESESFTVANSTAQATYTIDVVATDATGESVTRQTEFKVAESLSKPLIDADRSYIAPHKTVPKDDKTEFNVFVTVSDPDGLGDITSVIADFISLGLSPQSLERDSNASDGDKRGFYSVEGLTVPKNAPYGVHEIEVVATDSSGSRAIHTMKLEVTDIDVIGDPPIVDASRAYTTPKVAVNDGETPFSLQVFVRDGDDDIENVVVNLGNIGQIGKETGDDFGKAMTENEDCPGASKSIVCLKPSIKEGNQGQWFVVDGLTISKDTAASSEPYYVDVIATDLTGKTDREEIPISVYDGQRFTNDKEPPKMLAAVATNSDKIEVIFNEEISALSLAKNGSNFTVTDRRDVSKELEVTAATIDATGTVVTLTTEAQSPGADYVVSGDSSITDAVGVNLRAGASNRVAFEGFAESTSPPVVDFVSVIDSNTLEIEFRNAIRPSSLRLSPSSSNQAAIQPLGGGRGYNIQITEADDSTKSLAINSVQFGNAANVLTVKTANQVPDRKYKLVIRDIESAGGVASRVGITKFFKGFRTSVIQNQNLTGTADLNGDGRVDFLDFTMFSAVYGQVLNIPGSADSGGGTNTSQNQSPQPITPDPDATVPTTDEPGAPTGDNAGNDTETDTSSGQNEADEADVVDLSDSEL